MANVATFEIPEEALSINARNGRGRCPQPLWRVAHDTRYVEFPDYLADGLRNIHDDSVYRTSESYLAEFEFLRPRKDGVCEFGPN